MTRKQRMRSLELPEYMRALAKARQDCAQAESERLTEHIVHLEWMEKLAADLGIAVDAEEWWDLVTEDKRTKIEGRINVLRSLRTPRLGRLP